MTRRRVPVTLLSFLAAAVLLLSCKKHENHARRIGLGQTFSFDRSIGGMKWDCVVIDGKNLGKKIRRIAVLEGEKTPVAMRADEGYHFERLHLKITNRGTQSGSIAPSILSMALRNPDATYARSITVPAQSNSYLDPDKTPPFLTKDFQPVPAGTTREYWEITLIPDALPIIAVSWGTRGDREVQLVHLQ
jgi:hypothetical protein